MPQLAPAVPRASPLTPTDFKALVNRAFGPFFFLPLAGYNTHSQQAGTEDVVLAVVTVVTAVAVATTRLR